MLSMIIVFYCAIICRLLNDIWNFLWLLKFALSSSYHMIRSLGIRTFLQSCWVIFVSYNVGNEYADHGRMQTYWVFEISWDHTVKICKLIIWSYLCFSFVRKHCLFAIENDYLLFGNKLMTNNCLSKLSKMSTFKAK